MPCVEADVSENSSVESDTDGDNPQDEVCVENVSTEDCVGDNDIVNNLFR